MSNAVVQPVTFLSSFESAMHKFDQAAKYSLDHNLLKFNAPEYFMNAALCAVCIGVSRTVSFVSAS